MTEKPKNFLVDDDITPEQQTEILNLALEMKKNPIREDLKNKSVAVLFDKTSTRTRFSFDVGVYQLAGHAVVTDNSQSQMGKGETYQDTGAVLSRFVDMIVWRTGAQSNLEAMAETATVPMINALSDDYHPCQILADLLTIKEHKGKLEGLKAIYLGDGNNMANSYMIGFATAGVDITISAPQEFSPEQKFIDRAQRRAEETGATVTVTTETDVIGYDVVITDTWVSMGQDKDLDRSALEPYQVNELMMSRVPDALFMHCLPAYRGYEVTEGVIDGPQSVVFDEAENRLHAQKALMAWLQQ